MNKSHPTTFATCRRFTDICLDLPDIVSFNIYSDWYVDATVKERCDKEIKWSEERQADIIEECLDVYMNDENISGVFIWQFADCRVTEEGPWYQTRARCHNNKGVVDEYRRPKMSYDIVKEKFTLKR